MVKFPTVSIIIPVFNNIRGLERALIAISQQTYAKDLYEIIVIDNGSNDNPKSKINNENVIYIEEHSYLGSPYSARNRGLEIAKGEIIVLLDTTCAPVPNWLEEGVKSICKGYDLVGGDVVFEVSGDSTIGEMYDSLINIRMFESIKYRQVAKTTNLFIKKSVFDTIGFFEEGLRSGGDVRWTARAVKLGHKLGFSGTAKVYMLPRSLRPLIRKQWRVSKGQPIIWLENGCFLKKAIMQILFSFLPPDPRTFWLRLNNKPKYFKKRIVQLFLVGYFVRIIMGFGSLLGMKRIASYKKSNLMM